jgi:mRNA-degrading endonuclease RelE of RelBE toxin-antitoxin system
MPRVDRVEVLVSAAAQEKFEGLPKVLKVRVAGVYERLQKWPAVSGAKPLRYGLKNHFRIRTGDWRVVFTVEGNLIRVVNIDNRKDVYED